MSELLNCPKCGADCRIEYFPSIQGNLYMCGNNRVFEGDFCVHPNYLSANDWNTASSPEAVGEAVAWLYEKNNENDLLKRFFRQDIVDEGYSATPLYRHPVAAADREVLAKIIYDALSDRLMRPEQAYPAADAILAALHNADTSGERG